MKVIQRTTYFIKINHKASDVYDFINLRQASQRRYWKLTKGWVQKYTQQSDESHFYKIYNGKGGTDVLSIQTLYTEY